MSVVNFKVEDDGVNVELLSLERESASPADNDSYDINLYSENDNNEQALFGQIRLIIADVTDGSEAGHLKLSSAKDGALHGYIFLQKDRKVGINTEDPDTSFHVVRPDGSSGIKVESESSGANAALRMKTTDTEWYWEAQGQVAGSPLRLVEINGGQLLRVEPTSGRVGLKRTATTNQLEVAGSISVHGGSFIDDGTTLNVPDYVFELDYQLDSLDEFQKYVNENKHLKGLPGLEEVKEWAKLTLQDRDMKLLEKIEEQALYIIDLHERLKKTEQQLEILGEGWGLSSSVPTLAERVTDLENRLER